MWTRPITPPARALCLFAAARTQEIFVVSTPPFHANPSERRTIYAPGTALVNLLNTNEIISVTPRRRRQRFPFRPPPPKFFSRNRRCCHSIRGHHNYPRTARRRCRPVARGLAVQQIDGHEQRSKTPSASARRPAARSVGRRERHDDVHRRGAGLAGLANIVVRVTNAAVDAVSGNAMFAPMN